VGELLTARPLRTAASPAPHGSASPVVHCH
jgi:hypothetical protein